MLVLVMTIKQNCFCMHDTTSAEHFSCIMQRAGYSCYYYYYCCCCCCCYLNFIIIILLGNVAIARSYVSGATTQSERVGAFAGISASQAVGFVIGPG